MKLQSTKINALADEKLEIFTNSFSYHSDDYFHKNIGSLFGIIQVSDHSKNSEYLPNLLISVLKKAFYSSTDKTTEKNFELALKKMNLALADLAEHDIVEWSGNLHAIVGAIHEDTLLFTQVGQGLIFIGRDNKIMHLSESNTQTTHPIKTFKDIIIGKIKIGDKIIVATPTITSTFKTEDISRLYKTFSTKEFDDILFKTLKNEGENVSAVIINIKKEISKKYANKTSLNNNKDISIEKLTKNKNFLGSETQKKEKIEKEKKIKEKNTKKKSTPKNKKDLSGKLSTSKEKTKTLSKKQSLDMTQKSSQSIKNRKVIVPKKKKVTRLKTNQDIISNDQTAISKTTPKTINKKITRKLNDLKEPLKDDKTSTLSPFEEMKEIYLKDDDFAGKAKKPSTRKLKSFFHKSNQNKKNFSKNIDKNNIERNIKSGDSNKSQSISISSTHSNSKNITPIENELIKNIELKKTTNSNIKNYNILIYFKKYSEKIYPLIQKSKYFILDLINDSMKFFRKNFYGKIFLLNKGTSKFQKSSPTTHHHNNKPSLKQKTIKLFGIISKKMIPSIKKNQKIILIVLFVVLTPFIIGLFSKSKKSNTTIEKLKLPETPITQINKNVIKNKDTVRKILLLPEKIKLMADNEEILLVYTDNNQLYEINKADNKNTKITIPDNISLANIKNIDYISSLNLFFLSSDKSVISYSPKTKKFIPNKITLPNNFQLTGQGTYLSYLYLLDQSSKQIYRYPRATGGFGDYKKWLYQPLSHKTKIAGMAIDENIYVIYSDGLMEKYSKGKLINNKQFDLKSLDFIETSEELKSYYILSRQEGKILKINKSTNTIEKEYQNKALHNTITFTVDEKNKSIYLFDGKELLSIDL